jgi:hypothetical protein
MTDHLSDYTDEERRLLEALPRSAQPSGALEQYIVSALHDEGLLRSPRRRLLIPAYVLLAASLVVAAWKGGARYGAASARAASIEGQLERQDMSSADRILLMQRSGSAYVAAANAYAASVKQADATAVEVSSQVLLGAAQAVARANLGGAVAPRLATALRPPTNSNAVIWY